MECGLVNKTPVDANCRHVACSAWNIRIAAESLRSDTLESVSLANA